MPNDSKRNHDADLLKQIIDTIQTPLRMEATNEQTPNESNPLLSHEDLA